MKFAQKTGRLLALAFIVFGFSISVSAQNTAFTYQGKLSVAAGQLGNGVYQMHFRLFETEAGGNSVAPVRNATVTVADGFFTVNLDFGAAPFQNGAPKYLEISIGNVTLSPRQRIGSLPSAIRADGLTDACNPCVTNGQIVSLDGSKISGAVPNATNAANAAQLGGVAANNYAQANSTAFVRNQNGQQTASFNITGTGKANLFDAAAHFSIGGNRVLSAGGASNVFAGIGAGSLNAGENNSFFGANAGANNSSGTFNSFFGADAGVGNTTGDNNTFIGDGAGRANSNGAFNTFFGSESGAVNGAGGSNTFFGAFTGTGNTTGTGNLFLGSYAGSANQTGNSNTIIGYQANVSAGDLTHAAAIGADATVSTSNTIVLGRADGSDKVRIYGLGAAGSERLCRNADNEIAACTGNTQPALQTDNTVNEQIIEAFRRQITKQQQEIIELKQIVCSLKPDAAVCKEPKIKH